MRHRNTVLGDSHNHVSPIPSHGEFTSTRDSSVSEALRPWKYVVSFKRVPFDAVSRIEKGVFDINEVTDTSVLLFPKTIITMQCAHEHRNGEMRAAGTHNFRENRGHFRGTHAFHYGWNREREQQSHGAQ